MKKIFILLYLFSFATLINAQWIINGFESDVADSIFFYSPKTTGLASGTGSLVLTDVTDPVHSGKAAMKVDYVVHSSESYGGYTEFQYLRPQDGTFFDWSSAQKLRLWYYVITPYSTGSIYFRLKILESGGSADYVGSRSDHEDWYFQGPDIYGAAPGWNYIDMPLIDRGGGSPNAEGFSLTGWSGTNNNQKLDFDKIVGWMVDFITDGISGNGTATGTVVFDDFEFIGTKYPPVSTFDSTATNNFFVIDDMSGAGALTLTDITNQPLEGYSSLQLDVKVNNNQSWGGYVNMTHTLPTGTYLPDLSARTSLVLYVKVLSPFTGADKRVSMRFFLFDGTNGENEGWQMTVPVDLYKSSDWQMIILPLENKGYNTSGLVSDGFVVPNWAPGQGFGGDGVFNLAYIHAWKIEFSGTGDAPYVQGEVCEGSIMVDLLTPEGYRETDKTPPDAPGGLLCTADSYSNLITWNDLSTEDGETYNVYYSEYPIASVADPLPAGVEVVRTGITKGTQYFQHLLRSPKTDQSVSYYYAVNAVDKAGNIGPVSAISSPVVNTARGVPIITYDTPPTDFVADGNLQEWTGIAPLHLSVDPSHQTAFVVTNSQIDGDADLMCDVYLAMDGNYLYAAFDIEDDVFVPNLNGSSWLNDCPDLFIGLYDWHGAPHSGYHRGAEPDYHVRFAYNRILFDGISGADPVVSLGENYFYGEKFPTGYTVEARIPWSSFASIGKDNVFVPKRGMRIPIDYEINDNDDLDPATSTRTGQMDYSVYAEGNSYSNVWRWAYTWISDQWVVGVKDNPGIVNVYDLKQNYPNPFNPNTQITYSIEKPGLVTLKIFDMLGREIKELVNQSQNAGSYTVNFDASNLSSGIYLYQINSGNFQSAKKMILIK
jgi:hypothetical protein